MLATFDWGILNWIQTHMACGTLDWLMPKITMLGEAGILWVAIVLVLIVRKKTRREGILIALAMALGAIVGVWLLKMLVQRARPCWITGQQILISVPKDYSWPSGHTLIGFTVWPLIMKMNKKAGIVTMLAACIIAFSRLYLYVHFPTDVISGAFIGFAIAQLTWKFGYRRIVGNNIN